LHSYFKFGRQHDIHKTIKGYLKSLSLQEM
jgi:hypothetical protein